MRRGHLDDMIRGWFVGDFEPTLFATEAVEVGIKRYTVGEREEWHHHKVSTEITAIVVGRVRMGDQTLGEGDIIVLDPNDESDFEALTDVMLVVAKVPATKGDKYVRGER